MSEPISVCLPTHSGDVMLAVRNLEWQAELGTRWTNLVISHDATVANGWIKLLTEAAKVCYEKVETFQYENPPRGYWKPNTAFQNSARRMQEGGRPWLWVEPDEIPLCKNWIQIVDREYHRANAPFFGPVVKGCGHTNGTCVYPADTPELIPKTMQEMKHAWDAFMKPEMEHLNYDASKIIQHAWSMQNGELRQFGDWIKPTFRDAESLKLLLPTAVLFHRNTDGTLIARLRERLKQ